MTLEDFFTLTEMKNGLTTCARVEELICVMKKLNCVTNNVGDAARQWSAAASTLASTQNQECLRLFVHLNGLGFLNQWLQEAVQYCTDVPDGEELINTLLGSLDNLPANPEKLSSSGIFATVEKLLGHTNVNIEERAQMLFNKWNNKSVEDDGCKEMEKESSYPVGDYKPSIDPPLIEFNHAAEEVAENSSRQAGDEGTCKLDSAGIQNVCDDDHQLGGAEDLKCLAPDRTMPAFSSIENEYQALSPPTATVSDAGEEHCSVQEGNFLPENQAEIDDLCKTSVRRDIEAEPNKARPEMWKLRETSGILSSSGLSTASHTKTSKVFRSASCNLTLDEGREPMLLDAKEALHKCVSVDGMWLENSKKIKEVNSGEDDSSYNLESTGDVDQCDKPTLNSSGGANTFIHEDPPKTSNNQVTRETKKGSDSEPESGEMDALEIARLVAIEVEREVVDYREELCSSSPEVSSDETVSTASPSIEQGKQDHSMLGKGIENESIHSKDATDLLVQENLETLNRATVDQGPNARAEIGKFDFDLNEDACAEDFDSGMNPNPNNLITNLTAPIAVSASKGAPVFMIAPLSLDAGLGWKGSAATSAFRPASPRRTSDGEKSESGPKYRPNLFELDLNLTGTEDHLPSDVAPMKEFPVSSSISRNSSSEVTSPKAKRIKFDLNSNDDGEAATPLIKHRFLNNGRSSSPASSSSPRQQPHKNFDLNHNLFSSDAAASTSVSLSMAANPHGIKTEDSEIPIMGSRMLVEQRAHANQAHQSYFGNGFSFEPTPPSGVSVLPYHHQIPHPAYSYIPPGATGMTLPFQPAVYGFGAFPHMIDSRGATVVPQLLSSVGVNGTATPPFLMSITNAPSSSNGRPSPPGLDLNFGLMPMETEAETAETIGNSKLPVLPGRAMEGEQINNSGNPLKRKETESGWESYSYGYKHLRINGTDD